MALLAGGVRGQVFGICTTAHVFFRYRFEWHPYLATYEVP